MRLHVEAEFTHDSSGDLVSTNEPAATPAPRFFLGNTTSGIIHRYGHAVPSTCRKALERTLAVEFDSSMTGPEAPLDPRPFEDVLSQYAPVRHTSVGLAFSFPVLLSSGTRTRILRAEDAARLHPSLAPWAPDIAWTPPLLGLLVDGQVVAVCGSVRITPRAHEAGVETAVGFRGRGYARVVVAAWGMAVRALGVEPLYSTTWQNVASRGVARALGLVAFGRDLHIT